MFTFYITVLMREPSCIDPTGWSLDQTNKKFTVGIAVIELDIMRLILKNNPSGNQSASESMSILQNSKLNDSSGALSSTSSEDLENFIDANNRGFVGKICLLFISQY